MGRLSYMAITSLDGYIEDDHGRFDWAQPSPEVHQLANDITRTTPTHLYGRRLYETMAVWETDPDFAAEPGVIGEFAAIWQAADKIVYSKTLPDTLPTRRSRVVREFEPGTVRALKAQSEHDLSIGGAELAALAFRAGLVDELHLVINPVIVGGGKRALPDHIRADLELVAQRTFPDGTIYLHHRIAAGGG
jgi:dihydrofolate reductase